MHSCLEGKHRGRTEEWRRLSMSETEEMLGGWMVAVIFKLIGSKNC